MIKNAKAKGSRSERKVRDDFEARGWWVIKAGGSLGMWDLVCLHPDHGANLIQVKSNGWPGPQERLILYSFQCHKSWTKSFANVRDRQPIEYREPWV